MDSMSRIKLEEELTRCIRRLGNFSPEHDEYKNCAEALVRLVEAQKIMKLMDNIGKI